MSGDGESGLDLVWTFGFSSWVSNSVHDLHPSRSNCLVSIAGLHAVIYNYVAGQQQLLIGHTSAIGAIATSADRSVIVTAESEGHPDGLVIIWESSSGLPLATRNLNQGVASLCTCPNGASIALLTHGDQCVLLWTWAQDVLVQVNLSPSQSPRFQICWNPTSDDVYVTGSESVTFLHIERDIQGGIKDGNCNDCQIPNSGYSGTRAYGKLQHSVHIPNSNEVLSGTDTGTIIVWAQHFAESHRTFMKAVPLGSSSPITFIDVVHQLIAVASKDQALRFLDLQFRIVFWFEDFAYGPINSLSFASTSPGAIIVQAGVTINIPEFIFATSQANVVKLTAKSIQAIPNPSSPRGFLLVKGFGDDIACIAAHPSEPVFAAGTRSGSFQLIDYVDRTIQVAKHFNSDLQFASMAFSYKAENRSLAIALRSSTEPGQIQICSLQNRLVVMDQFEAGRGSMHLISFSWCDSYLAMASSEAVPGGQDQRHLLYLYEKSRTDQKWVYLGRAEAHSREIIHIEFDRFRLQLGRCTRLLSLSLDRTLALIDLPNSSMTDGVRVPRTTVLRLDMTARPVSMYLHMETSNSLLSVSDSCGKVKTFVERETDGQWICIRTGHGPVNDQYLAQRFIPLSSSNEVMAYTSAERFLGLIQIPVSFNQNTAVIGHAGPIDQAVAGFDGNSMLSCDSRHQCIHLWRIDQQQFRFAMTSNSVSYQADDLDRIRHMISYVTLKQYGRTGESPSDVVELKEVVNVMRALGCYLSQENIEQIYTELRWKLDPTQASIQDLQQIPEGTISLQDFLDLLLNHRPVNPDPDLDSIAKAFRVLGSTDKGDISLDVLMSKWEHYGEHLSKSEFEQCYRLINPDCDLSSIPSVITPTVFVENLLNLKPNGGS